MSRHTQQVLALFDAGATPVAIVAATGLPKWTVYAILRRERPSRARAPRRRISAVPVRMRALAAAGVKPDRVATLLRCSRAYAYRVLAERP